MHIKKQGPRDGSIRRLAFLDISLPLLHDDDVKRLSFTFYGGREHETTIFVFLFLNLDSILYNQLTKNSLTLNKLYSME